MSNKAGEIREKCRRRMQQGGEGVEEKEKV